MIPMDRRGFLFALAGWVLVASVPAEAQLAGKTPRVGVLVLGQTEPLDSLLQSLRDLGWSEGRNIVIERRFAQGRVDRLPALAAELVRLKVDVIVAAGGPVGLASARDATKSIPIVMIAASSDPVADGLIESYARPGGNITGLANSPEEVPAKRLELLKEAVPKLTHVGVLWDATVGPARISKATAETSKSLGVQTLSFEVRGPADLDRAISAAAEAHVGAMIIASTPRLSQSRTQIVELLTKHRLPAISLSRSWPEEGLLMSYGSNLPDLFRRAAVYVDKILKGARPADLAVERPSKLELVINLSAAKALGLVVPQSLLLRADEVIQ
jgi:putative tryptophan/tyrosine transport system substrate-binding protein